MSAQEWRAPLESIAPAGEAWEDAGQADEEWDEAEALGAGAQGGAAAEHRAG